MRKLKEDLMKNMDSILFLLKIRRRKTLVIKRKIRKDKRGCGSAVKSVTTRSF